MKHQDLTPWMEYFDMLRQYEEKGFLELHPDKHEAYTTVLGLFTMTPGEVPNKASAKYLMALKNTAWCIAVYAGWKSQQGEAYLQEPFALHVVKAGEPHDMLYTLLLRQGRRWWWPWKKVVKAEVVLY